MDDSGALVIGAVAGIVYGLFLLLTDGGRVSAEDESIGLDEATHGERRKAYFGYAKCPSRQSFI